MSLYDDEPQISITANIGGLIHEVGKINLRDPNVKEKIEDAITEIRRIEREKRRELAVSKAYSIFMEYNVLPSQRGYTTGVYGMSLGSLKFYLSTTKSIDGISAELNEWQELLKWIEAFNPTDLIQKWQCENEWASTNRTDYDNQETSFIRKVTEQDKILKEAVEFVRETIPVYEESIKEHYRQKDVEEKQREFERSLKPVKPKKRILGIGRIGGNKKE
jgi:NifB/MoaA-like Fe-S oxidoreductase